MKFLSRRTSSSIGIPITSSEAIEALACEIAQPWPEKRTSSTRFSPSSLSWTFSSSPQSGLKSSNSRSGLGQLAPVMRLLVVIQDVLAIEVVHQPNTPRTEPSASIRRSTSSRVEWTAKLARDVAGDAEAAHQRLRAVVAGADADALAAEDLRDVVRVHAVEVEGDDAAAN